MGGHYRWRAPALTSAALPLLMAATASAQSAPPSSETSLRSGATEVGEVVVTATRKEESLSKVAESVSAFTAQKMEVLNIKSFADLAKFTPGVTFDPDNHDISIRGINSTAGSGTTGIYIDDTPVQIRNLGLNANNTLPAVFDLQRVEVLRGPQGTLFGAGSEGGTVRYITTQPSLTTYSGMAHTELAYTEDGSPSYEAGFALGGPIVEDKLGFRISAWGRRDGGWIDRVDYQNLNVTEGDANRVDTYVLRAAATWAPSPNLLITPGINYQKRDQHNYDYYWVSLSNPAAGSFLNGTPDRMADPDRFYMPTLKVEWSIDKVKVISNTSYYNRLERVNGYSGTLYNLSYFQHFLTGDPNLQSVWGFPALPATDADGNPIPCPNNCGSLYPLVTPTGPNAATLGPFANYFAQNLITNAQQNFTQEIRLQSDDPAARLQWTAGFFYAFDRQQSNEQIIDPQLPALTQYLWNADMITAWGENLLPGGVDYDNNTRAKDRQEALFADASYLITDKLKLEVGVRYAWTHFAFINSNDGPQDLLQNGGVPAIATGGKDEKPFTPKVGLSYQITPDDLVYATASKGYRIGGATPPLPIPACGPTPFPTSYDSDSVWSYEAGAKDRFFDRTVQVAASAYYIRWSNIQQAFYVPLCGIQFTTNAGEAVSKGFDFQGQWQPNRHIDLEASVGYTNARFTKTALDANGDVLDVSGDSLDVTPWMATLAAQFNFAFFERPSFLRVDYEFNSKRTTPIPNEDPNTAFYDPGLIPNPATNLVSARLGVNLVRFDVALFVDNLFNAHPRLNLTHQDSATTLYEATTFRPLTVGVSASFRY
ncbi:MAG: TonB-dependent receptor [Pseudomonadota bacterium]|nr:TonB-dependent receptor [Pseudomonadota bacterium]